MHTRNKSANLSVSSNRRAINIRIQSPNSSLLCMWTLISNWHRGSWCRLRRCWRVISFLLVWRRSLLSVRDIWFLNRIVGFIRLSTSSNLCCCVISDRRDLSNRLNLSPEEGEKWIVSLIRETRSDAKIDFNKVCYFTTNLTTGNRHHEPSSTICISTSHWKD